MSAQLRVSLALAALLAAGLGCNLIASQTPPTPAFVTITPLPGVPPVVLLAPTVGPTPVLPACAPAGWSAYIVAPGDTLYDIALATGTTIEALTAANCLTDPNQIEADQVLAVPVAVASGTGAPGYYLIASGDNGQSGPAVGCGDSAVFVPTGSPSTGDVAADLRFALGAMLAYRAAASTSGLANAFESSSLTVQSVAVNGDRAVIAFAGSLASAGVCADARITAQLVLTIFRSTAINSAIVTVDGHNLKQILDATGLLTADALYTRADLP
jgi:LysM repeat protein